MDNLDSQVRERIVIALARFAETNQGDLSKLRGTQNEWRLRVGNWRVRLKIDNDLVHILRVLHRREAYR